jgi:hypothetical protein
MSATTPIHAGHDRAALPPPVMPHATQIPSTTLRGVVAEGSAGEAIGRLAELTGSIAPRGAVLLAERNGEPVAAIGIMDGQAVAHPELSTLALRMRLQLERLYVRLAISIGGF